MTPPVCLTVAGTDSGGAAGVAADLATFAGLGVHGGCVVTAVTAQDTTGVHDVHPVPTASVQRQWEAVLGDLSVAAVKTGMLGTAEVVEWLSHRLAGLATSQGTSRGASVVVDPVLVATSGAVLGDAEVARAYVEALLPVCTVVTPNLEEARALAGDPTAGPRELAGRLSELGPAVVVTGGPDGAAIDGPCRDWLAEPGREPVALTHPAVDTEHDHGTGCTFSAALAAHLAHGLALTGAVEASADFTTRQLRLSRDWRLGRGRGSIAHLTTTGPVAGTRLPTTSLRGAR
ncbi:bifunctional hydroxymethylpyrimidine kinase/phosphomethylpyrimidine kinase [Nocardioides insulae]|uniref:bifunctional hydroxymethylpyrimidine kinase/phosphomethylpyrimidine kinase n=1 Tax=Nocardioides insulae TaxID=394734 RepID=UPI0003FC173B|nr:bifunctional hydroxymethylpyrimidine kinase/phosphomethylpyrimidine kinase [Nocardioides insulae]